MRYDATIKGLIDPDESSFISRLASGNDGGARVRQELKIEYITTNGKERRSDTLALMDDGRIIHIEFQTKNDSRMHWRMLEYYSLIAQKYKKIAGDNAVNIEQWLLFVGAGRIRMADGIHNATLQFRYRCCDVSGTFNDGYDLMASPSINDKILGLLCMKRPNDKDVAAKERYLSIWRSVAAYVIQNGDSCGNDFGRLAIVAALRNMPGQFVREIEEMALEVNVEEIPFLKQMCDHAATDGRLEFARDLVMEMCDRKGFELTQDNVDFLLRLSEDELRSGALELLTANSLGEAFPRVDGPGLEY